MRKARVVLAGLLASIAILLGLPRPASAAAEGLEVHVLDCGALAGMPAQPFLPDMEDRPERLDMVNRCFLVSHPSGTLLWDAGLPSGFLWRLATWGYWLTSIGRTSIQLATPLTDQLAALGVSRSELDYVAFSHSHFDHVGQGAMFTSATWLVQRAEHDWLTAPDFENDSVQLSLLQPLLDAGNAQLLDGDHDVFGDGSVVVLSAPGHTPGHQCLFVDLPGSGPVVLSGDLYHSLLNRERREPPQFNTDREQTRTSMERIETFLRSRGATLWIQHEPRSGPLAPATLR